ncbi:MAG: DNA polymerase III subunit beta [Bdellovibrionales bacterium]|jgi:DNA polymerase-3 subunit beta|nr:DNA polymerase III subunit beta [Bdellovibrionales bacterium]
MMIEVEKKDLLGLLGKTQNIVEKRNTMPVLINVLLEAKDGVLKVFATDLEVSLTDQIPTLKEKAGKVAVSAKSLFEIVKELDDGPLTLTKRDNNWLEIKQRKSVFNLVGIAAEEYPVFPSYATKDFMTIKAATFADMIEKTIYSVSNDETRYYLNGVFFERLNKDGKSVFRMVATDGFRLSIVDREMALTQAQVTQSAFPAAGVIIPRKGLFEIKKMLETIEGDFDLAVEGSQLVVRRGSTVLMVRLIEGKFPSYQQFIPQSVPNRVQIPREILLSSLKRVSLLSNQKYKGITLALTGGRMEITSNNPELGDAKEEIEVDYKGGDIKIGFNARYMLDVLNSFDDDGVDLHLNDQLSPGLMRPRNDQSYTCVVMPMRI